MVASNLRLTLEDHMKKYGISEDKEESEWKKLYYTLYCYGASDALVGSVTKDSVLKQLDEELKVISNQLTDPDCDENTRKTLEYNKRNIQRTIDYCKLHYDDHIHVLSKGEMDDWLIPTVIPIAELIQYVNLE